MSDPMDSPVDPFYPQLYGMDVVPGETRGEFVCRLREELPQWSLDPQPTTTDEEWDYLNGQPTWATKLDEDTRTPEEIAYDNMYNWGERVT